MANNPLDKLKEDLKKAEELLAGYDKNDPTMHQIIINAQERVDRLKYEVEQEEGLNKRRNSSIQYKQGGPPPGKKKIPKIGLSAEEVRELRNLARKKSGLEPLPSAKKEEAKKPSLTPQDKKVLKAIQTVVKPQRYLPRTSFNLPQFTTDNSTSIVLACILIIAFLELQAGTKFVTLWNDAFSPATATLPSNTSSTISQNHNGLKPLQDTSQNITELNKNVGGGSYREYDVPNSFHYLEGALW